MKLIFLILTVALGSLFLWSYVKSDSPKNNIPTKPHENVSITPTTYSQKAERLYEFVPYWSFTDSLVTDSESSLIYFGVGVNANGMDTVDLGYKKLEKFVSLTPNAKEKILAIRMVDKEVNAKILKSLSVQQKIASSAVSLALKYDFDGVLLDYETSAFAFDSTVKNITSFYQLFSNKVKSSNLKFYVSLYGDTYYQARPYDVKKIGGFSDKVLIMAYDFSKSRGNPGPNFPLINDGKYGYDFSKMIDDFKKEVENEKIVVTFGYFGYDWEVDKKGESITNGVPLSTNEIEKKFVKECKFENCIFERPKTTFEPTIKYNDDEGNSHVIWYEDEVSVDKKKEFLKSKGILETAAWAYSYY